MADNNVCVACGKKIPAGYIMCSQCERELLPGGRVTDVPS